MYIESYTAGANPAKRTNIPSHSAGPQNFVDSSDHHMALECDDQNEDASVGEIGMFGDFCLMCGEMMNGEGFDGRAYCSEECEYHQSITPESDWCDLSLEGYQLPSYGCSTAVSSAKTSPLNSPNLQASGRLAILCSGPPPCELLLPLDLGERLLGAKAVAERYLEKRPKAWQDDGDADEEKKAGAEPREEEETAKIDWKPITSSPITPAQKPLVSTGSHLKSRPALAQLTALQGHHLAHSEFADPPERSSSQSGSPHSLSLIDLPLRSSPPPVAKNAGQTLLPSSSSRRVSDPAPISVSPSHHQLYHSSFSLSSLSSLSLSPRDCSQSSCCSPYFA